jgi:hypothetical protein
MLVSMSDEKSPLARLTRLQWVMRQFAQYQAHGVDNKIVHNWVRELAEIMREIGVKVEM